MATIYLWDGGTNTSPYDTWAKAATTLSTAWSAWTSGDIVYMQWDHQESQATTLTLGSGVMGDTEPFQMYSVDKDNSDAYRKATAYNIQLTSTADFTISDSMVFYGCWIELNDGDLKVNGSFQYYSLIDCTVVWTTNTALREITMGYSPYVIRGCLFDNQTVSTVGGIRLSHSFPSFLIEDCTFQGHAAASGLFQCGSGFFRGSGAVCDSCDFSGLTNTNLVTSSGTSMTFRNCAFASGDSIPTPTGGAGHAVLAQSVAVDGASTAKTYITETYDWNGTITQDTAVFRDSAWSAYDGSTPLSNKMSPDASLKVDFWGPTFTTLVTSTGSKTVTVYALSDFSTTPTVDEAWIQVYYLGTANSVLCAVGGGRQILSSSTLATDTSSWTGDAGKNKIKFSESITVNKTGPIYVTVHLRKYELGKALWYCPKVEIT